MPEVLQQFPVRKTVFDRGDKYPGATFDNYSSAVSSHRKTPQKGDRVLLDNGSVVITVYALNGGGVQTTNENDLSLSTTVSFGNFKAEISGDLSGDNTAMYRDIETPVAESVGRIDVYKVHHHCSSHSTNEAWLNTTQPTIGIVSTGDGNSYGHPTSDCLERLHKHNVKTYWTETGNGAEPEAGVDLVAGNIVVEVAAGATSYAVRHGQNATESYPIAGSGAAPPADNVSATNSIAKFAWSKNSPVYHFANCDFVANISEQNLQTGGTPPDGKRLHKNCPLTH